MCTWQTGTTWRSITSPTLPPPQYGWYENALLTVVGRVVFYKHWSFPLSCPFQPNQPSFSTFPVRKWGCLGFFHNRILVFPHKSFPQSSSGIKFSQVKQWKLFQNTFTMGPHLGPCFACISAFCTFFGNVTWLPSVPCTLLAFWLHSFLGTWNAFKTSQYLGSGWVLFPSMKMKRV